MGQGRSRQTASRLGIILRGLSKPRFAAGMQSLKSRTSGIVAKRRGVQLEIVVRRQAALLLESGDFLLGARGARHHLARQGDQFFIPNIDQDSFLYFLILE